MDSKTIRNFLRSSRRRGRGGLLLYSPHPPRPQVTARGCSRAPSRVGRGGARSTRGPRPAAAGTPTAGARPVPHGRDPHQGPCAALTLLRARAARQGRTLPAPTGAGRLRYLGGRRLLPGARGRDVHQRQPGLQPLGGPSVVHGPHRPAGDLPAATAASGAGSRGSTAPLFRPAEVAVRRMRVRPFRLPTPSTGNRARPLLPSHLQVPEGRAGRLPGQLRCPGLAPRRPPLCCSLARMASVLESSFPRHTRPLSVIAKGGRDPRGSCNLLLGRPVGRLGEYAFISPCGAAFSTSRKP